MTHSYQTSRFETRTRNFRSSTKCYQVEVEDFDNEYHYFDIEAHSFAEASEIVTSLCSDFDIYNMNIYEC